MTETIDVIKNTFVSVPGLIVVGILMWVAGVGCGMLVVLESLKGRR